MKIKYFKKDDILSIQLSNNPVAYAEESSLVIVNFDKGRQPVSIEILDANKFLTEQSKALPPGVKSTFFATA